MVQRPLTWRVPAGNVCFLGINELKLRFLTLGKAMVASPSYQWSSRAEGTYPGPNSLHPGAAVQQKGSPAERRSHGTAKSLGAGEPAVQAVVEVWVSSWHTPTQVSFQEMML